MRHQYNNPRETSIPGQLCYVGSSVINAYTLTSLDAHALTLALGAYLSTTMCLIGLATGYVRKDMTDRK